MSENQAPGAQNKQDITPPAKGKPRKKYVTRSDRFRIADFEEHIKGSGGIMSTIARRARCDWSTAQRYINKHERLRRALQDEVEGLLDAAESVLVRSLQQNDVKTAKWLLAKKGKNRGYGDGIELAADVVVRFVFDDDLEPKEAPEDDLIGEDGED